MATNYGERIAKMEERTETTQKDVVEIKGDVKAILDTLNGLDGKFVTRTEFSIAKWLISLGFSIVALFIAFVNYFKG